MANTVNPQIKKKNIKKDEKFCLKNETKQEGSSDTKGERKKDTIQGGKYDKKIDLQQGSSAKNEIR